MEAQSQIEGIQAISYQHANGEIFAANDLEAARGMCPVLGKMSLEEAGLLLELEAMGKEQIADRHETDQDKPAIEKVEKVPTKDGNSREVTEPAAQKRRQETVPEVHLSGRQLAERATEALDGGAVDKALEATATRLEIEAASPEEADILHFQETEPTENEQPATGAQEAYRRTNIEYIETARLLDVQQKAAAHASTGNEYAVQQRNGNLYEQPDDMPKATELEVVGPGATLEDVEFAQVYEATIEPELFEAGVEAAGIAASRLDEAETLVAVEPGTDYSLYSRDGGVPVIDTLERSDSSYNDAEVTLTEIVEPAQFVEKEPVDRAYAERRPLIVIPELPSPVAEVETAMEQLVGVMEKDETVESGKVEVILEEIIALPAKLEVASDYDEEVIDEKLAELFVELFKEASISYTPGLINSFVKLTKAHYLEELFEVSANRAKVTQSLPDEIGTREFLQKLRHSLNAMKKTVVNFYELGRSILRLYAHEPLLSPVS